MNRDTLEGSWMQLKGHLRTEWGKLTDDDVETSQGRAEHLVGKLQERYGLAKEAAEAALDAFLKGLDAVKAGHAGDAPAVPALVPAEPMAAPATATPPTAPSPGLLVIGLVLFGSMLSGCLAHAPWGSRDETLATIRAADELGAAKLPQAGLHLQLAKEQADAAAALAANKHPERAGFVWMRAEADADLALALAREATLRAERQAADEKLYPPKSP